jgi:signal transduction histidine kinase
VQVTVTDRGRGFDPTRVSPSGFGLREDMPGWMAAVGGAATVQSQPGAGTMVALEWRRD